MGKEALERKPAFPPEETLKEIYELHKSRVYNTVLSVVQNVADAEEITQDVFMDIFRSINEFEGRSSLSTWIYRISLNKSFDHLKKKKRKKRFAWLTSLFDPDSGELIYESADFEHPGILMENSENARILFNEIDKLAEKQKAAFLLYHIENLSYEEISKVMETTISSVESLLFRAKKNLRNSLGEFYKKNYKEGARF